MSLMLGWLVPEGALVSRLMGYWQDFSRSFASFAVVPARDNDENIGSPLRSVFAFAV